MNSTITPEGAMGQKFVNAVMYQKVKTDKDGRIIEVSNELLQSIHKLCEEYLALNK